MSSDLRPRILYVDYDEDCRDMLCMLMTHCRIEAKAVGTAGEALSSIHSEQFDLYLLDARLPDVDGFELCRQMRDFDSRTPILFFSGVASEADKKMGFEVGANAYIAKPDIPCLLGNITQFIPVVQTARASRGLG